MKRIILSIFFLFALDSYSQITFEKLYINSQKQTGWQGIQLLEGYLLSTKIDNCGLCNGYIQFIRIDDFGDTMRTFNIPNFGLEQGAVSTLYLPDHHLVIAAINSNSYTSQVTIINSDTLGNVAWHFTYGDSTLDYIASSMIQTDSSYLITGRKSIPGTPPVTRTFLLSVDLNGNFNWIKTYGDPFENYSTGLRMQGNEIFIAGDLFDTLKQKMQPFILSVDTGGNLNHSRIIDLPIKTETIGITGDDSSHYIYGHTVDSVQNTNIFLMRLNYNLDTIWTSILDLGHFETAYDGITMDDGGVVLSATVRSAGITDGDILLCRYDSSGNIQYTKTIPGFDNEPYSASIIETNDHGFLCVSTSYNNLNYPSVYVFKTDSLGDIVTLIKAPVEEYPLNIYPNPSQGVFNINHPELVMKIEIYSQHGSLIDCILPGSTRNTFSVSSNGMYFIRSFDFSGKCYFGKFVVNN